MDTTITSQDLTFNYSSEQISTIMKIIHKIIYVGSNDIGYNNMNNIDSNDSNAMNPNYHPIVEYAYLNCKNPMVVGISGKIGSGKTTLANKIKDLLRFSIYDVHIINMSDPLKETTFYMLKDLMSLDNIRDLDQQDVKNKTIPGSNKTIRDLLIKLGTDVGRDFLFDDFWIELMKSKINSLPKIIDDECVRNLIIIPDIRFENEMAMVREFDGIMIKMGSHGSNNIDHVSETTIDNIDDNMFDYII